MNDQNLVSCASNVFPATYLVQSREVHNEWIWIILVKKIVSSQASLTDFDWATQKYVIYIYSRIYHNDKE